MSRRRFIALFAVAIVATSLVASPSARAESFQVLHAFNGADGNEPLAGLTAVGSTLYGTTAFGGANNLGAVFSMNRDGTGFQVLHAFTGAGAQPEARLTLVGSTLYGTTNEGGNGSGGHGTIYSMNLDGTDYHVLHAFTSTSGIRPYTGLTAIESTLYGTTSEGGANNHGTIFSMNLDGTGYQVLHSFNGSDGDNPYYSDLTAVGSTLYGTTAGGGANGRGTIFSMNLDGTDYEILHSFNGSQGQYPHGALTLVDSTLYGTTSGSSNGIGNGTIFSMNVDGTDYQVLHSLLGGQTISSEGGFPEAGLTLVGSTLYGTTSAGGIGGTGNVFSMNLDGTGYQVIHSFKSGTDGFESHGSLTLVGSTLYGTARYGGTTGSGGYGTVFSISVPEPSTFVLAVMGVVGLFALRKRRHGACAILPLAALTLFAADAQAVTIEWDAASGGNGHVYQSFEGAVTWQQALNATTLLTPPAGFQTGHLVTVTDAAENQFLFAQFGTLGLAWMGFTDESLEGEWRWIDDTPGIWQDPDNFVNPIQTAFTNWDESTMEPNDQGEEDYGVLFWDAAAPFWNDGFPPSSVLLYQVGYIAEFEPVPEPSTFALAAIGIVGLVALRQRRRSICAGLLLSVLTLLTAEARAVTIDTVPVGNAGNAADPATGYGAVAYDYRIGTTEVTVGQYTEFLNAMAVTDTYGLYNPAMASAVFIPKIAQNGMSGSYSYSVIGSPNKPVTFVSWGDAARFVNWMHNGQPTGGQSLATTENGAYFLNGATSPGPLSVPTRNAGAQWFLPSQDEWYKAAYHKNDGSSANYWQYPTSSNIPPYSDQPPGSDAPIQSNTANVFEFDGLSNGYNDGYAATGSPTNAAGDEFLTDVGVFVFSASPYGTFDQAGNVSEWIDGVTQFGSRGTRGSDFAHSAPSSSSASSYATYLASGDFDQLGFRVATIASVPEPSTFALAALGIVGLLAVRKRRRASICASVLVSVMALSATTARAVTIDTVPVGNAGNAPDPETGRGAVAYNYRIGTTEVTNSQYAEFLNAKAQTDPLGLFDRAIDLYGGISRSGDYGSYTYAARPGMSNQPVNYINWYNAIRFTNWLNNGQGDGDTETGAYTLLGGSWQPSNPDVARNPGATWFLPSEDEWYKAAYHKNDGVTDHYWDYPTSSDTMPVSEEPPGGFNSANYDSFHGGVAQVFVTDVGAYVNSPSPYGTFDQGGSVAEWNETYLFSSLFSLPFRGLRGGWGGDSSIYMLSSKSVNGDPLEAVLGNGFRVATVPEPSTFVLCMLGMVGLFLLRWRRRAPSPAGTKVMATLALVLAASTSLAAEPKTFYSLTDLSPGPHSGVYAATARAINDSGQVVVNSNAGEHFLYQSGVTTAIPIPRLSEVTAISNTGLIVGSAYTSDFSGIHAVLYDGSSTIDLGTLGGNYSFAYGVNDSGQVVGQARVSSDDFVDHAFLYENGAMTDLGSLGLGLNSVAYDINNSGQAVGTSGRPVLYSQSTMTSLRGLDSTNFGTANAINNNGQVVGVAGFFVERAFLHQNGVTTNLGTLPGDQYSDATAIADTGQIVGNSSTSTDFATSRVFSHDNGIMTDVSDRIDLAGDGWTNFKATGVNNSGTIVGSGVAPDGFNHAVMLTPLAGINTTLTIDPSQSFLTLTSDIEGIVPINEQAPGSLTTALQGAFDVDIIGSANDWNQIRILSSGEIHSLGHEGSFLPGNAPADLAGFADFGDEETGPLLAYAAFRNSSVDLSSGFTSIDSSGNFALDDLLATLSSTLDYDIAGQLTGSATDSLTALLNGHGHIEQIGNTLYVTIPIDWSAQALVNGLTLNYHYTGQIVATAHVVPEPSSFALAGLGSLVASVFWMRRRGSAVTGHLSSSGLVRRLFGPVARGWQSRRITRPASYTIGVTIGLISLTAWATDTCRAAPLKVMSFNILMSDLESAYAADDHWFNSTNPNDARRLRAFNVIHNEAPDILGLQEVSAQQLGDLSGQYVPGEGLLEYDHYAVDPGINSYFTAIYYRRDRFTRVDQGIFALTTTPDDLQSWRTTAWVVLADSLTGQRYFVLSTHLDPFSSDERTFGAQIIQSKLQELAGGLPIIMTGDFNDSEMTPALLAFTAPTDADAITLSDPYRQVHPVRTFFESSGSALTGLTIGNRIDFVLSSPTLEPISAEIVRTSYDGKYPSDHYPVTVTFDVATVPEPSAFILAVLGAVGLFMLRSRRREARQVG